VTSSNLLKITGDLYDRYFKICKISRGAYKFIWIFIYIYIYIYMGTVIIYGLTTQTANGDEKRVRPSGKWERRLAGSRNESWS
jgi:hypothetical protein